MWMPGHSAWVVFHLPAPLAPLSPLRLLWFWFLLSCLCRFKPLLKVWVGVIMG